MDQDNVSLILTHTFPVSIRMRISAAWTSGETNTCSITIHSIICTNAKLVVIEKVGVFFFCGIYHFALVKESQIKLM